MNKKARIMEPVDNKCNIIDLTTVNLNLILSSTIKQNDIEYNYYTI